VTSGPSSGTAGDHIVAYEFAPTTDRRLAATTNVSGRERALVWDVASGERRDLPPGAPSGDIVVLDWSPDGRELLLCRIEQAEHRLLVWSLDTDELRVLDHPEGAVLSYLRSGASYFRPDGHEIVCRLESFAEPRRLIGLDPATGRQTRTLLASGDVPPGQALRSVSFPTADGTPLQAWLGVPDGVPPYPVVLETHGGPTAAQFANFHPIAQSFLDEGFAVLSLNYRGSTSFGREFEQSIWGRLGQLEAEDLAAARMPLSTVRRPDLPSRLVVGATTLLGPAARRWAGGMAASRPRTGMNYGTRATPFGATTNGCPGGLTRSGKRCRQGRR
jgi:dipeptidyl aminopeptidase/acylaminoacyl peptidase